jgi:RND family efflux transporter MFP subunit
MNKIMAPKPAPKPPKGTLIQTWVRLLKPPLGVWGLLFLASCQGPPPPSNPPTPVNLVTVKAQRVLYYDKYPATTQALSQVNLYPEVQGYITGIYFTEGTNVKKGQQLYEIDKRLYQAAYDQAGANLKVAQGNQVQAQQDADRYEFLNSKNAVAKQQYDHAVIALQNAKNQTAAADQAVKTAQTNFAYSVITAPFDGTVGFSQVKMGNMVTIGQTVLNTISTNDPMAVDFLVNEKQLMDFEALEKRKQAPGDSLFTILLPNNTLYPYTGKISVIDRAVDAQTGAIRVRLEFPNPKSDLKVGMSCVVRVHNQEAAPQLVIPGKAIVEQMGEYFVFVVRDTLIVHTDSTQKKEPDTAKGPSPRAFQKKVQLGQTIGANVIVKDGISEGDRIVIDGVQLLHDGSKVALGSKKPGAEKGNSSESKKEKKE